MQVFGGMHLSMLPRSGMQLQQGLQLMAIFQSLG
jgi:hypothetical protein